VVEEVSDDGGDLGGLFEEEEMAATGDQLQAGIGDEPGQDAAVGEGDYGVVVAGDDQGGLG
jgi:hypothetical protein